MTQRKQQQPSLWEGIVAEDVKSLWEPWMVEADRLLNDEELIDRMLQAQNGRHENSATKGRPQTPAEVALRMLLLKHVRNWSFDVLEREVRANLAYRDFCRIGLDKVPDAKTLARLSQALGNDAITDLHRRLVEMAKQEGLIRGRKMRLDTTVVETNIHYPTDSSLLGDGARVLTRTMKKVEEETEGKLTRRVRNRMRSVKKRVIAIARSGRLKGAQGEQRRQREYRGLLRVTRQILNDTKRVMEEVEAMPKRRQAAVAGPMEQLKRVAGQVKRVVRQTKRRIFEGLTQLPGKIVSLFEPHTEIIKKGKARKPTEFGKMVLLQEAENQIITSYEVFDERPSDGDLLRPAVEKQKQRVGRVPELVAGDAGFYSKAQETAIEEMGVKWVSVPNRRTKSEERREHEKQRWFKKGQRWRAGCEGRISVTKRRHGLDRCLYRGQEGMKRWVGLGVLADTLINMGRAAVAARA
jgi:IS5 family transposase